MLLNFKKMFTSSKAMLIISLCLSPLAFESALQAMDEGKAMNIVEAARADNLEAVELLLAGGADPDYQVDGRTALMTAAIRNQPKICKLLIANGANVNLRRNIREGNFPGESALMGAARRGNPKICKLLLQHGADVHQLDDHGHTALQEALNWGRMDVSMLLIDATLKAPIDPARLIGINLTPDQRREVVALMASLKKNRTLRKAGQGIKGTEHLQADTISLMGQTLSNTYKLKNMIRAQIETSRMHNHSPSEAVLLKLLDRK